MGAINPDKENKGGTLQLATLKRGIRGVRRKKKSRSAG